MFKTAYSERERVGFETQGESLTQQHFAKEADIKNIIKKHDRTGIISHVARGIAQYGDYSEINEFREALDLVNSAEASFMELPSDVRAYFHNDAGEFFEFANDPKNAEKMVELGLMAAPPIPEDHAQPAKKKAEETEEVSDE